MAPFEAFYGRPCNSPSCWLETGETFLGYFTELSVESFFSSIFII